jgi:beta-mannosidase
MQVSLTKEVWQAKQYDPKLPDRQFPQEGGEWFSVTVPGAVQYDLVNQGKLENPYASTKAAFDSAWVAKSDWIYRTEFATPPNAAAAGTVLLRLKGVDTYAEVWLNKTLIGETANAYRIYDFPVQPSLLSTGGKNSLVLRVKAHSRMIADKIDETEKHLNNGRETEGLIGKSLIRRYQRSFFSGSSLLNLGTGVLGIGIVRDVELLFYSGAYLSDCCFRTLGLSGHKALGAVHLHLEKAEKDARVKIKIQDPQGKSVFTTNVPVQNGKEAIPVAIENPELWWPKGYGKPSLYTLTVTVEQNGSISDELQQQIGIRTSELITKDERGRDVFYFRINGRKVLVHGENHIPLDYIKSYGTKEEYDRLFTLFDDQYVNMIRIWGGGVVEDHSFYDECDKRGIMLFQELFLHSNLYPDFDEAWVKEFLTESEGVLKQVRVHPCLCIVCGGNEQHQIWDEGQWRQANDKFYGEKLVTEKLPVMAKELCPELPYIYNSPHGGKFASSPVAGESHNWGNFYNSTKDPIFVTETCWTQESYSRPETLKKYMNLDVDEFTGLNWAAKWRERTSLGLFTKHPYSDWFEVKNLRLYLHSLEIEQMRADYSALSMYRFGCPSNSGVIYWSFNKGGPLFQFGCVDYGGYPMMPYYAVKKVFAPIAVQARRDVTDVVVMLSNQGAEALTLDLEVFHLDQSGKCLGSWSRKLHSSPEDLTEAFRLKDLYNEVQDRTRETIYVCASIGGKLVADDMLFFCPYAEYDGAYQPLKLQTEKVGEGKWRLRVEAEAPVRMVELESNHKLLLSDDYFPMIPGKAKVIELSLLERTSGDAVQLKAGILGSGTKQDLVLG